MPQPASKAQSRQGRPPAANTFEAKLNEFLRHPGRIIRLDGGACCLINARELARRMGCTVKAVRATMRTTSIPPVYIGKHTYYNESAFARAMFLVSELGSTGFAAPGSWIKAQGKSKRGKRKLYTKLTDGQKRVVNSREVFIRTALLKSGATAAARRELRDLLRSYDKNSIPDPVSVAAHLDGARPEPLTEDQIVQAAARMSEDLHAPKPVETTEDPEDRKFWLGSGLENQLAEATDENPDDDFDDYPDDEEDDDEDVNDQPDDDEDFDDDDDEDDDE